MYYAFGFVRGSASIRVYIVLWYLGYLTHNLL